MSFVGIRRQGGQSPRQTGARAVPDAIAVPKAARDSRASQHGLRIRLPDAVRESALSITCLHVSDACGASPCETYFDAISAVLCVHLFPTKIFALNNVLCVHFQRKRQCASNLSFSDSCCHGIAFCSFCVPFFGGNTICSRNHVKLAA